MAHGFFPPPPGTDLVGYEALIAFIRTENILALPGDLVEIGAFCGGGTCKLARMLRALGLSKRVYAMDCFDISADPTTNNTGLAMKDIYRSVIGRRTQRNIFDAVTRGLDNIVVLAGDSKKVALPAADICFAFIDGNHAPDYVESDFEKVWRKVTPGGVVAFHDYGWDLPEVTATIDTLCLRHRDEIAARRADPSHHIFYVRKRQA